MDEQKLADAMARAMMQMTPQPAPAPVPVSVQQDGISNASIGKWIGGVAASLVVIAIAGGFSQIVATDRKQNTDINKMAADFSTYMKVEAEKQAAVQSSLDRIESNTHDRITRSETMREIKDLIEDIKTVRSLSDENREMLIERSPFMTTTNAEIELLKEKISDLQEKIK